MPGENTWLSDRRLRHLLSENGEYPAKYRPLIWRFLLKLPEKQPEFDELADGVEAASDPGDAAHAAAELARAATRDVADSRTTRTLVRVCGALARWCPALAGAEWLAHAASPFVVVFGGDALCAFEALGAPRPAEATDVDELLADKTDDFFPDLDDALDAPETADYAADVAAESGDDALLRDFADSSEPKDLDLGELDAVLARARGALVPDLDGEDEITEG